jgi:hypothetical protein
MDGNKTRVYAIPPVWTVGRDLGLIAARKRWGENFARLAVTIRTPNFCPSEADVEERWDILMGDPWGDRREYRREVEDGLIPSYEEDVESGAWVPHDADDEDDESEYSD